MRPSHGAARAGGPREQPAPAPARSGGCRGLARAAFGSCGSDCIPGVWRGPGAANTRGRCGDDPASFAPSPPPPPAGALLPRPSQRQIRTAPAPNARRGTVVRPPTHPLPAAPPRGPPPRPAPPPPLRDAVGHAAAGPCGARAPRRRLRRAAAPPRARRAAAPLDPRAQGGRPVARGQHEDAEDGAVLSHGRHRWVRRKRRRRRGAGARGAARAPRMRACAQPAARALARAAGGRGAARPRPGAPAGAAPPRPRRPAPRRGAARVRMHAARARARRGAPLLRSSPIPHRPHHTPPPPPMPPSAPSASPAATARSTSRSCGSCWSRWTAAWST
jgi:hypothetical protein